MSMGSGQPVHEGVQPAGATGGADLGFGLRLVVGGRRGDGGDAVFGALGEEEVEHDGHDGRKTDAGEREVAEVQDGAADAGGERHGDDDHIARRGEVDAAVEQAGDAGAGDRAEEQEHDAAEDGLVDAAQQGTHLAHQREDDTGEGGDAEHEGIGDARERRCSPRRRRRCVR